MKLKIILIILACSFSLSVNAQNKFSFGIKGGLTLSNITVENNYGSNIEVTNGTGINVGLYVDIIKENNFTLSSELYYANKRADFKFTYGLSNTFSFTESVDYFIYGVIGKYSFNFERFKPYIYAEPRLNFYLGDDITMSKYTITPSYREMISERFKRFGFGLNLGAGIDFINTPYFKLFAEAQFCPDLFYSYEEPNGKVKSNAFEFKIGCGF